MTSGQEIVAQMENRITSREGDNVKLRCNYKTSASYAYLSWFKLQSDYEELQFILRKQARGGTYENIPDKRYSCKIGQEESELTIRDVTLADSAEYYCALDVHSDTKRRRRCTKTYQQLSDQSHLR